MFRVSTVHATFYFPTVHGSQKSGAWRGSDSVTAGFPVPREGGAAGPAQGRGPAVLRPFPDGSAVTVSLVSPRIVSFCPFPSRYTPFSATLTALGATSALYSTVLTSQGSAGSFMTSSIPQKTFAFQQSLPDGSSMVASYPVTSLSKYVPSQN